MRGKKEARWCILSSNHARARPLFEDAGAADLAPAPSISILGLNLLRVASPNLFLQHVCALG